MEISQLDGFEIVKLLREDSHLTHVKIIAMSTREKHGFQVMSSCDGFIQKPLTQDKVIDALSPFAKKRATH